MEKRFYSFLYEIERTLREQYHLEFSESENSLEVQKINGSILKTFYHNGFENIHESKIKAIEFCLNKLYKNIKG